MWACLGTRLVATEAKRHPERAAWHQEATKPKFGFSVKH